MESTYILPYEKFLFQLLWRYKPPETKRNVEKDQVTLSKFKINLQPSDSKTVTKRASELITLHTTAGQPPIRKGRSLLMLPSTNAPSTTRIPTTKANSLRVRKEYRTLTLAERTRFHNALNALYQGSATLIIPLPHPRKKDVFWVYHIGPTVVSPFSLHSWPLEILLLKFRFN